MFSGKSNTAKLRVADRDQASALALGALVWIVQDGSRAQRLLDLTGLSVDELRQNAGDPSLLAAVLGFLASHEPDLIACAEALGEEPLRLMSAKEVLES